MDLLQTVRKEGSRGGRGDFKWSDVQSSSHRENYLGHSLMAPVGRWQKNKDLSWYAKADLADGQDPEARAAAARKEEIRLVKQAEEDALARALGYEVPIRPASEPENPNLTALGGSKSLKRAVEESVQQEEELRYEETKGIGFGGFKSSYGRAGTANGRGADSDTKNSGPQNDLIGLRSKGDTLRDRKHRRTRQLSRSLSLSRSRSRSRTRNRSRERDRRKASHKYSDRQSRGDMDNRGDRSGDTERNKGRGAGRHQEKRRTYGRHRDGRTASPSPYRQRDRSRDGLRQRTSRGDRQRKQNPSSREDEQRYRSDRGRHRDDY